MIAQPANDLTVDQARAEILNGQTIKLWVGHDPDDPVLLVYEDDGAIYHTVVAGWSQGMVECVCERDSDYLLEHLSGVRRTHACPDCGDETWYDDDTGAWFHRSDKPSCFLFRPDGR